MQKPSEEDMNWDNKVFLQLMNLDAAQAARWVLAVSNEESATGFGIS